MLDFVARLRLRFPCPRRCHSYILYVTLRRLTRPIKWNVFFRLQVFLYRSWKIFFFPELSLAPQRRVESIMLIAAAVRRTFTENSSLNVKSFSALTHTRDKAWVRVWLPAWLTDSMAGWIFTTKNQNAKYHERTILWPSGENDGLWLQMQLLRCNCRFNMTTHELCIWNGKWQLA